MGVVRTNIVCENGTTVVGGTVDLPTRLNTLSANGGNGFVTLSLGYSNTSYITGVQVNYKTGSYPSSPTDGSSVKVSGAATSVEIAGLNNGTTYYFRVFLYRVVNDVTYYQTDITNARVTGMPLGVTVVGVTPLVTNPNYIVIASSGTFTMTAPKGTKITLAAGGQRGVSGSYKQAPQGGKSGYVAQFTVPEDIIEKTCILTLGESYSQDATTTSSLEIEGVQTYNADSGVSPRNTAWGYIGGTGGNGAWYSNHSSGGSAQATSPTGAGGGGGGIGNISAAHGEFPRTLGGGNSSGNHGGAGSNTGTGGNGSSGAGGYNYSTKDKLGSGGGGGFGAGGGASALFYSTNTASSTAGGPGSGGAGVLVIEW